MKTENRRRGSTEWKQHPTAASSQIFAFADRVSAHCGQTVRVFISTPAPTARLTAFRMGYYHGAGARAVLTTKPFPTRTQSGRPVVSATTHMARAHWTPTKMLELDGRFVPGSYLLKVVDSRGGEAYVPLTVTSPASRAPLAFVSSPMTWQAYNAWGGASAYSGADGLYADRARVVSFDRPYDKSEGAATYFTDEYPLVRALEKGSLDVAYLTDVDVNSHPGALRHHSGVLVGAHAEYWTKAMRDGFERARDAGVNLAFLGANNSYWQVRLKAATSGPSREMEIYKSAAEDPRAQSAPDLATVRWRQEPVRRPESALIGQEYECYNVKADMVLTNPAWPFRVSSGTRLRDTVLAEYDRANLGPNPRRLQILATSPLTCLGKPRVATVTYYTSRSGAGVFSAGTMGWVCQMGGTCTRNGAVSTARARRVLTATTMRLARGMAGGPLGLTHPSRSTKLPPRVIRMHSLG